MVFVDDVIAGLETQRVHRASTPAGHSGIALARRPLPQEIGFGEQHYACVGENEAIHRGAANQRHDSRRIHPPLVDRGIHARCDVGIGHLFCDAVERTLASRGHDHPTSNRQPRSNVIECRDRITSVGLRDDGSHVDVGVRAAKRRHLPPAVSSSHRGGQHLVDGSVGGCVDVDRDVGTDSGAVPPRLQELLGRSHHIRGPRLHPFGFAHDDLRSRG